MRAVKMVNLHQEPAPGAPENDQLLDRLFRSVNAISPGVPEDGQKAENLDAFWVVFTTSATPHTIETRRHRLGRTPRGFVEYEGPQPDGVPNLGRVYLSGTPTRETISFGCSSASKRVRLLIF